MGFTSDDDSSESTSEESSLDEEDQLDPSDHSDDNFDDLYADPDAIAVGDNVTTAGRAHPEALPGPSEDLFAAIEALTMSLVVLQAAKQLPFLVRNLRRGFEHRCHLVGVPVAPAAVDISAKVVYQRRSQRYEVDISDWHCPLCELLGQFKTREMLEKHLQWDHDEVAVVWMHDTSAEVCLSIVMSSFLTLD